MEIINDIQSNYKSGWIRIYRSIRKHWLWPKNRPMTELEAWITILIEVNHESEKFKIGYEIFECNKGEKYYSLDTWAKIFNWNKSKVRRFLVLLQKDSMIELKSVQKTTHLTVCNYDIYQSMRNDNETIVKRKRNDGETMVKPIEELNNDKNVRTQEKEENTSVFSFEDFWQLYDKKLETKKCKLKYDKLSESVREKIKSTLPVYLSTITDKQYQKHPSTYLNNECWNDEIKLNGKPVVKLYATAADKQHNEIGFNNPEPIKVQW